MRKRKIVYPVRSNATNAARFAILPELWPKWGRSSKLIPSLIGVASLWQKLVDEQHASKEEKGQAWHNQHFCPLPGVLYEAAKPGSFLVCRHRLCPCCYARKVETYFRHLRDFLRGPDGLTDNALFIQLRSLSLPAKTLPECLKLLQDNRHQLTRGRGIVGSITSMFPTPVGVGWAADIRTLLVTAPGYKSWSVKHPLQLDQNVLIESETALVRPFGRLFTYHRSWLTPKLYSCSLGRLRLWSCSGKLWGADSPYDDATDQTESKEGLPELSKGLKHGARH